MLTIPACSSTGMIMSPKLLVLPTVATTPSRTARRAHLVASLASFLSSQISTRRGRPLSPPSALMLATAAFTPAAASGMGVALAVSVIWPMNIRRIACSPSLPVSLAPFSAQPANSPKHRASGRYSLRENSIFMTTSSGLGGFGGLVAKQVGGFDGGGLALECLGAARHHHPAMVENIRPVTDFEGLGDVLFHQQHRDTAVGGLPQTR